MKLQGILKKLYDNVAVILFSIAALLVLIVSINTSVLVNIFSDFLRKNIEDNIILKCELAAELISEKELAELTGPEDMEKPLYHEIKKRLVAFGENNNVLFVYFYRYIPDTGSLQPLVDNDYTENSYSLLLEPLEIEKIPQKVLDTGKVATTRVGEYSVGFDGLISAFAPVFGTGGSIIALAGVDVSDEEIIQTRNRTIFLSFLLLVSIIFVIISGFLIFLIYGRKETVFIRRFAQQDLMAELAKSLITSNDAKTLINDALRITGIFLNISRMAVKVSKADADAGQTAYVWYAAGRNKAASGIAGAKALIEAMFPVEEPKNSKISSVYCGDTQKDNRYEVFNRAGIKAFIWSPLYIDGTFWAVLSIEDRMGSRVWTESDRQLVSTVSSVIAAVAAREIRERERDNALYQAKQASQAKSDFLANMSHEMRTPMNAIIGMTSIAKTSRDIEKKEYCLNKIEEASTHLLGVINDILDMSKIEANKFELSPVEFEFERMLRKVVNVINFRVEERHQEFSVHIDNRIPRFLYGDDQRLAQVITNLLSNAVKFTPEYGSVRLDTRLEKKEGDLCTLSIIVTDSGIGISKEQQGRLFTSFEQADSGTSRKFGGTGLGLAISRRIVEMMGGAIRVESEPDKGAVFTVTVNVMKGKEKQEPLLKPGINWGNLRILVVDDTDYVRDFFQNFAAEAGISCCTASNGAEAEALVESQGSFDICFVDWKMSGMNGIELSRRITEHAAGPKPVVIMISAAEWSEIEEEARSAGVDKFLSKPLFPSAIADCINQCLGLGNLVVAEGPGTETMDTFPGCRILLAEDVEINREIVLTLLEPAELMIDCAENGVQAVELFKAAPDSYDMIFLDVQMPEMDGYEAARQIRASGAANAKTIPIIAMTANVFREDIERCLAAGMDGHLGKPLDMTDILAVLRKYLPKDRRNSP
ncbi:MAG: response regulator [Treponema sp.]|jgi:signal transduction histidine kinase/DNA-binding response OmpR family regulator|nr:response regulator [Treponema sp.]